MAVAFVVYEISEFVRYAPVMESIVEKDVLLPLIPPMADDGVERNIKWNLGRRDQVRRSSIVELIVWVCLLLVLVGILFHD